MIPEVGVAKLIKGDPFGSPFISFAEEEGFDEQF